MARSRTLRDTGPKVGTPAVVFMNCWDLKASLVVGEGTYQGQTSGPNPATRVLLDSGEMVEFDHSDPFSWVPATEAATLGKRVPSSLETYREDYHNLASGGSPLAPLKASLTALPPMPTSGGRAISYASVEDIFASLEGGDWVVTPSELGALEINLHDVADSGSYVDAVDYSLKEMWYLTTRTLKTVACRQPYLLEQVAGYLQLTMQAWANSENAAAFVDAYVENPWLMPVWTILPAAFLTKVVNEAHSRSDLAARDLMVSLAKWRGDTAEEARLASWPVAAPPLPTGPLFEVELWVDGSDLNEGFEQVDHPKACVVVGSELEADEVEAYARTLTGSAPAHRGRVHISDTFFTKRKKVWPEVYPSTLDTAKKQFESAAAAWGGI